MEYKAHRVAWVLYHGAIDDSMVIDHINGDKTDNRISNLRLVTYSANAINRKYDNKTSYRGVYKQGKNSYAARIEINGRRIHLGSFSTPEAAHEAHRLASEEHHGQYSYYNTGDV